MLYILFAFFFSINNFTCFMYFRNDIDPDNLEHEQSAGFLRDKLLQVFISTKTFGTNSENI